MANDYFKFKQFKVLQRKSAMRVGTDSVLLGAWANVANVINAIDVGTGTGVIALMLAQRNPLMKIDAVELDPDSAAEATDNVTRSPWASSINVVNMAFQDFANQSGKAYELIVSNPPYFNNSLKSPLAKRTLTRHTESLPYHDLLLGVQHLLAHNGRFCGIFPYSEGNVFIAQASTFGLYCTHKVSIVTKPGKPTLRILVQLEKERQPVTETELTIHNPDGTYTKEYKQLTSEFYLAF